MGWGWGGWDAGISVYMQTFGYSPLKIQCTAILLGRVNLKNLGGG